MIFDFSDLIRAGLPQPSAPWGGFPPFNFIGGHNDPGHAPGEALAWGLAGILAEEGRDLATYNLRHGPQGYLPLRELIAANLQRRAHMACAPDQILVTSGSLQALDLVNRLFLEPGDTVLIEEACYGGTMTRLRELGVSYVGVPVDGDGMQMDALEDILNRLKGGGIRPKFIYTIPTIQNPTGTIMSLERRHQLLALAKAYETAVFEDDCYADLIFDQARPPAIRALDDEGRVLYCGSFSKSIAPALRVGYLVADWPIMGQLLALKSDAGSGALEQMALSTLTPDAFDAHVTSLIETLRAKCHAMTEAVSREFGTVAEFEAPKGGIFLWVSLPEEVDTDRLAAAAAKAGVTLNPGSGWTADGDANRHRLRICFAHPSIENIHAGIAKLAEVCHQEFGLPVRSGNVAR